MKNIRMALFLFLIVLLVLTRPVFSGDDGEHTNLISPDGKYIAEPSGSFPAIDYAVKDSDTDEILFFTRFLGQEGNDIKRGTFSPDSRLFAAIYMYEGWEMETKAHPPFNWAGRDGPTTWVGIWDIASRKRIMIRQVEGYHTDDGVFAWQEWLKLPAALIRIDYDLCPVDQQGVDPHVQEIFIPDGEEGTIPGSRTALALSFCSNACRSAFNRNTTTGVAAIKAIPHSEHSLTIMNREGRCGACGKPALGAFFRFAEDEATFFCSEACSKVSSHKAYSRNLKAED